MQDPDAPSLAYTEPGMNPHVNGKPIKETELPDKFASNLYQVLIVANKYQTGFDQPLLCAMYVDKRLDGIQAVQTLSRLNRTAPGKEETFVLDFVNEREAILASFQDYYQTTTVADEVDPQRLYELEHELQAFQVYSASEVDGFAAVFFKLRGDKNLADNAKLTVFKSLYGFLGQIVPFADPDLEKLYAYGRMLLRKLPRPDSGGPVDLGDDVALASFKLKLEAEGDLGLQAGGVGELPGPEYTGTGKGKAPKEKLSTLIEAINQRFGTEFDAQDLVDGVTDQLVADEALQQAAKVNDKGNFNVPFQDALDDALVSRHEKHGDFTNKVFQDEALGDFFRAWMLDQVYGRLSVEAAGSSGADSRSG